MNKTTRDARNKMNSGRKTYSDETSKHVAEIKVGVSDGAGREEDGLQSRSVIRPAEE